MSIAEQIITMLGVPSTEHLSQTHTALAAAARERLSIKKHSCLICLNTDLTVHGSDSFKSDLAAKSAAAIYVTKAHREADSYFMPGSKNNIAVMLADEYANDFISGAEFVTDTIESWCGGDAFREKRLGKMRAMIENAKNDLFMSFEEELRQSRSYYKMYELSYFLGCTGTEKYDSYVEIFDTAFMNAIARRFPSNVDYYINGLDDIETELNNDISTRAASFFDAAFGIYQEFCKKFETIAEELGETMAPEEFDKFTYLNPAHGQRTGA